MKNCYSKDSAKADGFYRNRGHIARQTVKLASERLRFKDGQALGDLSIAIEDGETVRKVRRIVEKRVCQRYWGTNRGTGSNKGRYTTRRYLSNQLDNIYGFVPTGSVYDMAA